MGKTTTAALVCEVSLKTHTQVLFFLSLYAGLDCYIHDSVGKMDLCLLLTVSCVLACRSWASAMWR